VFLVLKATILYSRIKILALCAERIKTRVTLVNITTARVSLARVVQTTVQSVKTKTHAPNAIKGLN